MTFKESRRTHPPTKAAGGPDGLNTLLARADRVILGKPRS